MAQAASHDAGAPTPVAISGVSQSFGDVSVLKSIDLDIGAGETIALLGPSGCGKTTLLRLLAGLARPTEGRIEIGEAIVADAAANTLVPPERRGIGMVFQDYALWPHMSVAKNVAFPLEMRKTNRAEREKRTLEALALVGLDHLVDRQPGTLSGGQQQRVALARAIVARPSVILFDEPLSNLDRELRETLVVEISALLRTLGMTAVYVTHDHGEAFAIADRVAILNRGNLLQVDAPEALVSAPASPEVAEFLKLGPILSGDVREGAVMLGASSRITPPAGFLNGSTSGRLFVPRSAIARSSGAGAAIHATAIHSAFRGDGYAVQLKLENGPVLDIHSQSKIADGTTVPLAIAWDQARWFPDKTAPN